MTLENMGPVLIGVLIVLFIVGIIIYRELRRQKRVKALISKLNALKLKDDTWLMTNTKRKVILEYSPGSRYTPPSVSLCITGHFNGHCLIYKENMVNKFSKTLGVNKETQVLSPQVNEQFYFECDDEQFVQSLTQNPVVSDILQSVLQGGFTRVEINGNNCAFVKSPGQLDAFEPQQLVLAAEKIADFVEFIPRAISPEVSSTPKTDAFASRKAIWVGVAVVLLILGGLYWAAGEDLFRPLSLQPIWQLTMNLVLIIFPFLLIMAFQQLGGRAQSLKILGIVIFFGGLGLILFISTAIVFCNALMDSSSAVSHDTRVVVKRVSHSSKHGDTFYVGVKPGFIKQQPYYFPVSQDQYHKISIGDACVIKTNKGYLGYEWVSRHSCPVIDAIYE